MSGIYDAAQSGVGHLTSFIGTDSVASIDYAEEYYNATGVIGVSVPATEHSVMCMGTEDSELETFKRLICQLYPSGVVSIVSDTWDFWRVITEFTVALKPEILARQPNALAWLNWFSVLTLVIQLKLFVVIQTPKSAAEHIKAQLNVYGKCLVVQQLTKVIKY